MGDHAAVFNFLMGGQRGGRTRLFFKGSRDKKRSNNNNLCYSIFQFDTGNENFTIRVVKQWEGLPKKIEESPSWEMLNLVWKGP